MRNSKLVEYIFAKLRVTSSYQRIVGVGALKPRE